MKLHRPTCIKHSFQYKKSASLKFLNCIINKHNNSVYYSVIAIEIAIFQIKLFDYS